MENEKFYTVVDIQCLNCGQKLDYVIPKGQRVRDTKCLTCGVVLREAGFLRGGNYDGR